VAVVLLAMLMAVSASAQEPPAGSQTPPLVPAASALEAAGSVRVAGTVDHASLRQVEGEGGAASSFEVTGADGATITVLLRGKLPSGFDVATTVVLEGEAHSGRFEARRVLIAGAVEGQGSGRGLIAVMVVVVLVWLGLYAYVVRLDRKLRRLEG
jgi:CcmD family protein